MLQWLQGLHPGGLHSWLQMQALRMRMCYNRHTAGAYERALQALRMRTHSRRILE